MTPELAPHLLTNNSTIPHQREDVSTLDRFNVHSYPIRRVFNGTGFELVTRQATIRYLYHSATAAISREDCDANTSLCLLSGTEDLCVVRLVRWVGSVASKAVANGLRLGLGYWVVSYLTLKLTDSVEKI
ncbi:uncharacterized protein TNCV_392231 [Trichonephila clavipes]|nr:uncharacterized protein TNCV_392231 [Trichonephila clavipes]